MANPYLHFEFRNSTGRIEPLIFKDPLRVLQTNKLEEVAAVLEELQTAAEQGYYSAGFVSYEAAPAFDPAMEVRPADDFPLIWFGIFGEPERPDPDAAATAEDYHVSDWRMAGSPEAYKEGIKKIKQAIEEGDTYQVNYTERLHAGFSGSDFAFYRQLAHNQQAGYGAYLNIGDHRILSASPELFFRIDDGRLMTKPMKGTAPRGRTLEEDEMRVAELLASEKEQAENLMIVDLLRNDMSRLATKGSVNVTKLFEVETYPTVHQMTSTVEAQLAPGLTVLAIFKALFPCGSITGAPKISTMHRIAELEMTPRGVYCGAIGFLTPDKDAVFNVPIRTVTIDQWNGRARYGVGGGVTWDSTSEGEFRELQTKAEVLTARRPVFELLESLKLENGDYPLKGYHLSRLADSAAYFNFALDTPEVEHRLTQLSAEFPRGSYKVRLLLSRTGGITAEAQPLSAISQPVKCAMAAAPVDSNDPFLYHKTTHREIYEKAAEKMPQEAFSVLLWNEREELTEFAIGNLVLEIGGEFVTPPVSCGLLAGTFRQQLIGSGKIKEKVLKKNDLAICDAVWFINSVRGWLEVEMI
ncbi:aminodeoxychorismate synthase component I [Planococcus beigongshangi]|uniref:aminodeoxychorismate synthase component I n=1 Tax=Planococcus beigongshangi TaxID=2782536 RepID=UPI00193C0BCB|nr:aminodeoxychorismate synthase component I [Planococcus beigongshangi]